MPWWLAPFVVYLAPLLIFVGLFWVGTRRWERPNKRSPLTRDLLRSPGESLRRQIDKLNDDLTTMILFPISMPLLLYSFHQARVVAGVPSTRSAEAFYLAFGLLLVAYFAFKAIRLAQKRRNLVLGYEAECAVGQELSELLRDKYWVFHDVSFGAFNIDHVVVGRAGVFAVETKGRAKPLGRNGRAGWEVTYDGATLRFPRWSETAPLDQAKRQASALERWLTSAVGETVAVKPVLALPGWYIKRVRPGGVPVFNGKNPAKFFPHLANGVLSDQLVTRIAHQLNQRCRDVAPCAYAKMPAAATG